MACVVLRSGLGDDGYTARQVTSLGMLRTHATEHGGDASYIFVTTILKGFIPHPKTDDLENNKRA